MVFWWTRVRRRPTRTRNNWQRAFEVQRRGRSDHSADPSRRSRPRYFFSQRPCSPRLVADSEEREGDPGLLLLAVEEVLRVLFESRALRHSLRIAKRRTERNQTLARTSAWSIRLRFSASWPLWFSRGEFEKSPRDFMNSIDSVFSTRGTQYPSPS